MTTIQQLFRSLCPEGFEEQFNAISDDQANADIKARLGVQIEIMTGRHREVIQARKPIELRMKEALEEDPDSKLGMWS